MKIALTAWDDKISPVFDSSRTLLIAEIENAKVVSKSFAPFNPEMIAGLGKMLKDMNIEVLICGAIAKMPSNILSAGGVELISFVGGDLEEVLGSFARGERIVPAFLMPGCGRKFRKRRGLKALEGKSQEVKDMPNKDGTGPRDKDRGAGGGQGGCKPGQGGGKDSSQGGKRGGGRGKGCGGGQGGGRDRGRKGGKGGQGKGRKS